MRIWSRLLFAAVPPALAAGVGGLAARRAPEIYRRLDKPAWAPPAGVFGPVWSVLYTSVGVVGWRITRRPDRPDMGLHLVQIGLNASWTPLFFAAGRRRAALTVNVLLDVAIAAELAAAIRRDDRLSAVLLGPYLAWSGFATALTASVGELASGVPAPPWGTEQ